MWSTEINYGDGNGDGHGEGWSKIVKDGKRQWELVFTALSLHFHCISAFDFLSKNVPEFWLCRWTFISQKKKSRPPYGGRLFSVNIPKIWILWGLFPFSRFLPHFQCNSAFNFCPKNDPKFWLCRWTFISQKKKKADHQFWLCLVNSVNSVYIISRFDDFITLKIGNSLE